MTKLIGAVFANFFFCERGKNPSLSLARIARSDRNNQESLYSQYRGLSSETRRTALQLPRAGVTTTRDSTLVLSQTRRLHSHTAVVTMTVCSCTAAPVTKPLVKWKPLLEVYSPQFLQSITNGNYFLVQYFPFQQNRMGLFLEISEELHVTFISGLPRQSNPSENIPEAHDTLYPTWWTVCNTCASSGQFWLCFTDKIKLSLWLIN
jgi:hypothetical protein